jgi:hypothetical protein
MADKYEATFHQGRPLPQREPFETLASFDRGARPAPVDRMHYESPGRPPWEPKPASDWPLYLVAGLAVAAVVWVVSAFVWWLFG